MFMALWQQISSCDFTFKWSKIAVRFHQTHLKYKQHQELD
jgi:hypothetical protein